MEFWLIMIGFIVMGGSCSLAGTWWDRKNKKDKKEEKKHISYRNNLSSMGFSIKEIEAIFFAANLLMPQDRVKELYEQRFSLYEIADFFQVSYTAMAHRFDFLGYD